MSILDRLVEAIFETRTRPLSRAAIEEVPLDLPDSVRVMVRCQFGVVRVNIISEKKGRFEIVVLDEKDMRNDSVIESLSIPPTEHRRTWNKAALQTQRKEAEREGDSIFPAPEWNLHRFDSIVLGKASESGDVAFFLAVCLLRWGVCPSIHNSLYRETLRYIRRFIKSKHVEIQDVAEHIHIHLREPQGPHDVNRYVKKVIAGYALQTKPQIPMRWVYDGKERGMAVADAATYLEFSKQHIHNGIRLKRIRARKVGGKWFVPKAEIDRIKERRKPKGVRDRRQQAIERLMTRFGLNRETARKAIQRMERTKDDDGAAFRKAYKKYLKNKQRSLRAPSGANQ